MSSNLKFFFMLVLLVTPISGMCVCVCVCARARISKLGQVILF